MNTFAVIATHHKTGSVWMHSVFRRIATKLRIPFHRVARGILNPPKLVLPAIIYNNQSNFRKVEWLLNAPESRFFHLIRDPRDVIISGMHYHRTAREPWLDKPEVKFGGMSYQQKLNVLPDDVARYSFEMRNMGRRTIVSMRRWNYSMPNSIECKYEDLIDDIEISAFTKVLIHLGFAPDQLNECRKCFRDLSLFGDARKINTGHVRSGARRQWPAVFDRRLALEFIEQFGDVLIELGYECDNSWIDSLTVSAPAGETPQHPVRPCTDYCNDGPSDPQENFE